MRASLETHWRGIAVSIAAHDPTMMLTAATSHR